MPLSDWRQSPGQRRVDRHRDNDDIVLSYAVFGTIEGDATTPVRCVCYWAASGTARPLPPGWYSAPPERLWIPLHVSSGLFRSDAYVGRPRGRPFHRLLNLIRTRSHERPLWPRSSPR